MMVSSDVDKDRSVDRRTLQGCINEDGMRSHYLPAKTYVTPRSLSMHVLTAPV